MPKAFLTRTKTALTDHGLAQKAWKSAVEKVCAAQNAREIRKFRFRDVTIISADQDGSGTVHLALRSAAPDKAEAGIASHGVTLGNALRGFYGCAVKLRVVRHALANAPPDQPSKADDFGEMAKGDRGSKSMARTEP